jgi:hypothetical protein
MERPGIREALAVATLTATLLGGAACSGGEVQQASQRSEAEGQTLDQLTNLTEVTPVTDADLQRDDISVFNCGGKLRPAEQTANEFNGDYWIDYANDNPELGPKLMSFYDHALGSEAVDSLLGAGYLNGITSEKRVITADERADVLAHKMTAVLITQARTYANFSCKKGDQVDIHRATKKPTISIEAGGHVEAVVVDQAGIEDFLSKVNRFEDRSLPVDIIRIAQGGDEKDELYAVVLKAYGCDNPILRTKLDVSAPPELPPVVVGVPQNPGQPGTPETKTPSPRDKVPGPRAHEGRPNSAGAGGSPEGGDDPQNDSNETGYGPGDVPTATVPRAEHPQETLPPVLPPATTGVPRTPAPSTPATTEAPRPTVTSPELGD